MQQKVMPRLGITGRIPTTMKTEIVDEIFGLISAYNGLSRQKLKLIIFIGSEENVAVDSKQLNPRWRKKLPSVPKPEANPVSSPTMEPDLREFFEKLNQERRQESDRSEPSAPFSNESPDWWNPNSAPESEEDGERRDSTDESRLYEIHHQTGENDEEQLINTRYFPMSDDGRAGRESSGDRPANSHLILYEIEEGTFIKFSVALY